MSLAQGEEDNVGEREITTLLNLQCVFNCPINGNNEQVIPLSCMHFMCTNNCHRHLYTTGTLTCPLCQFVVKTLAKTAPDQEQPDSETIASVQLTCDVCGSEKAEPVVTYCPECNDCLCIECYHHHSRRATKTRAHVTTKDLTDAKMKEYHKLKEAARNCKQHDLELSEYCETCEKSFCKNCLACHTEEGHTTFNIIERREESMNLAKYLMGKYDAAQTLKLKKTAVGKQLKKIETNLTKNFAKFDSKLKQELLQIRLRREQEVKELCSRKSRELGSKKSQGAILKASLARFVTFLKDARFEGNDNFKLMSHFVKEMKASEEIYTKDLKECTKNHNRILSNTFEEEDATIVKLIEGFAQINYNAEAVKTRNENVLIVPEPGPVDSIMAVGTCDDNNGNPIEAEERVKQIMNVPGFQESSETWETPDDRHRPTRYSARLTGSKRNKPGNHSSSPHQMRKRHSNKNEAPVPSKRGRQAIPVIVSIMTLPASHVKFLSATRESIERMPVCGRFPIQTKFHLKKSDHPEHHNDEENGGDNKDAYYDNHCSICLDRVDEQGVILLCKFKDNNGDCGRVFHMKCHIPAYEHVPEKSWHCFHHTTKSEVQNCLVSTSLGREGSENGALNKGNKWHFKLACMFLMECYRLPETPAMRWKFPEGYLEKYGKVPFHLKHIRERLTLQNPVPFHGVGSFLSAFRQMFDQALFYYQDCEQETQDAAKSYIKKFIVLVEQFYPHHRDFFNGVLMEK